MGGREPLEGYEVHALVAYDENKAGRDGRRLAAADFVGAATRRCVEVVSDRTTAEWWPRGARARAWPRALDQGVGTEKGKPVRRRRASRRHEPARAGDLTEGTSRSRPRAQVRAVDHRGDARTGSRGGGGPGGTRVTLACTSVWWESTAWWVTAAAASPACSTRRSTGWSGLMAIDQPSETSAHGRDEVVGLGRPTTGTMARPRGCFCVRGRIADQLGRQVSGLRRLSGETGAGGRRAQALAAAVGGSTCDDDRSTRVVARAGKSYQTSSARATGLARRRTTSGVARLGPRR